MPISRPKIDLDPAYGQASPGRRLVVGWLLPYLVIVGLFFIGSLIWLPIDWTSPKPEDIGGLLISPLVYLLVGKLILGVLRHFRRAGAEARAEAAARRAAGPEAPDEPSDQMPPEQRSQER